MKALLIILIILVAIILIIMVRSMYEVRTLEFSRYQIKSKKIKAPLRIVFLSDLHGRKFGEGNAQLIKAVKSRKPDFIVAGGDMVSDSHKFDIENALDAMFGFANIAPVYYAPGNHELNAGRKEKNQELFENYKLELESSDIAYLADDKTLLDENINIYGLDFEREYYSRLNRNASMTAKHIEKKLGKINQNKFNILIAHTPEYFDAYADAGYDLVLSGHYHGGLARIPKYGGFISPKLKFFPDYCFGPFKKNNTFMIVTRGVGSHTLNIRLGNKPEIVILDIKPAQETIKPEKDEKTTKSTTKES